MTSLLREEVSVPALGWRSMRRVLVEGREARRRAMARPTAPAPMTWRRYQERRKREKEYEGGVRFQPRGQSRRGRETPRRVRRSGEHSS